jgi:hypothetical protein
VNTDCFLEVVEKRALLDITNKAGAFRLPLFFEGSFVLISVTSSVYGLHVNLAQLFTLRCVREIHLVVFVRRVTKTRLVENDADIVCDRVEPGKLQVDQNQLMIVVGVHQYVVFLRVVVAQDDFAGPVYHAAEKLGITFKQECFLKVVEYSQLLGLVFQQGSQAGQFSFDYRGPLLHWFVDDKV